MLQRHRPAALVGAVLLGLPSVVPPGATLATMPQGEDIDAFMEQVLDKREVDWDQLYNHVFEELERFSIQGLDTLDLRDVDLTALQSFEKRFTWYVREGYLVRSPYQVNGVTVADDERESAEQSWMQQIDRGEREVRIERDSFFDFEFEPGNYFFAGRESFEGHEVVRVEYYPNHLFADEGDPDDEDEDIDRMFDKTSLVTMLIDPVEHQIVKTTFANVGLEFLPYGWLVRVEDLQASMVMHKPIGDVWLPREISASAKVTLANGSIAVEYARLFDDYKQTEVGAGVIYGRPKRR